MYFMLVSERNSNLSLRFPFAKHRVLVNDKRSYDIWVEHSK